MIVWTGWGILTIVIFFGVAVPLQSYAESRLGHEYYKTHGWPGCIACLAAALLIWPIGRWLNREAIAPHANDLEDDFAPRYHQTGRHTLFFVPMEYWAFVFVALGIFYVFNRPGF
jgi:ribose/xylose/arabinose/galactoside ABC-type transport system permease subunit